MPSAPRLATTGTVALDWQRWRNRPWPGRLAVIRAALLAGLLAGVGVSWKLWITDRVFPHFPVWEELGPLPPPWDLVLFGVYLGAVLVALLTPRRRLPLAVVLALSVLLALQDQVRWQPWFYLYLLGLAGFLFLPGKRWEGTGTAVLGLVRLLLVALYFWSGYHKLHPAFDTMFSQTFVAPLGETWPGALASLLESTQALVPWLEIATAVLLLLPVPLFRKAGVVGAVAMHASILVLVGPLGLDRNGVIWPWNLCMMVVVPAAFWGAPVFGWRELVVTPVRYWAAPLVVLVGLLPAFSPGRWDRYLSFHLYSGREQRVMLVLNDRAVQALPAGVRPYLLPGKGEGVHELKFKEWAYLELKVPFPTEERLNLRMARELAALPFERGSMVFFYYDYEFELEERGWDMFSPAEMLRLESLGEPRRPMR